MRGKPLKILLIEDNPGDSRLVCEMLSEKKDLSCTVHCVDRLSKGLECLEKEHYDALLLDLKLPDAEGVRTFAKVHARVPDLPIIVLTGLEDETTAVRVVRAGAQDYLSKGHIYDGEMLYRTMVYAMERKRTWSRHHMAEKHLVPGGKVS